jgi:hypothetical protein
MDDARRIAALLLVCFASVLAAVPVAAQGRPASTPARASASSTPAGGACTIHSLPSFVDQGESKTASSVADIVEVECEPVFAGQTVKVSSQGLFSRCRGHLIWSSPYPYKPVSGPSFKVTLDGDGDANVALWAGPGCAEGESLISAHLQEAPYTTVATAFSVRPPMDTPPGVFALPGSQVEDNVTSSVAAIVQIEFPSVYAERYVNIRAEQLFSRCMIAPHLVWVGPDGNVLASGKEAVSKVRLDNNGNAFVVLLGGGSCASGSSEIEASLEQSPYTTYTTTFTVESPRPTWEEPAFAISKLQEIKGSGTGFVPTPLSGSVGQTVAYEIVVKNTGNVGLSFSAFSDPRCDPGTIAGGPGNGILAPGQSATYTCEHRLTAVGSYTNEATVTGTSTAGKPLTGTSNRVLVTVPPEPNFTIEKLQQIRGSASGFTTARLTGAIGQTVEYEINVSNTGNLPLIFSAFSDPRCDSGTIAGGPGEAALAPGSSATYTCSHLITAVGTYINVASVTGTAEGQPPITRTAPPVEVVSVGHAYFTIEKLQQLQGSSTGFTTTRLTAVIGQTVDYEIVVRNTGDLPLTLSAFSDARCDGGTIAGGPGEAALAPGSSTTYTCSHVIAAVGDYVNEAVVTATAQGEAPLTQISNPVEVHISAAPLPQPPPSPGTAPGPAPPAPPSPKGQVLATCMQVQPAVRGATGPKVRTFTLRVTAALVSRATVYLDGRRIKTLGQAQAERGSFAIKINPRRLSYGAHTLSVKMVYASGACGPSARSSVFVRPRSSRVAPSFTG